MKKIIRWYKEQPRSKRILALCGILLFFVALFLLDAYAVGSLLSVFDKLLGTYDKSAFYYAFGSTEGILITFLSFFGFIAFIAISLSKRYRNGVHMTDERGVHFMEENTYGSSRWMHGKEIEESFTVAPIKNTTTTIFGQLTKDGEKVVGWKPNRAGGSGNRNVIVLASMGSGKSYCYVRTELIQAALRGDSFVVTDPSAELYTDLAQFLMELGHDVKVLNLAEPNYSEFWNIVEETIDPETERLDSTRLNDFVSIYMQNSGDAGDMFWYNSAQNLLKAVIGYTAYKAEKEIQDAYCKLYRSVCGSSMDETERTILQEMDTFSLSFPQIRQYILEAASKRDMDTEKIKEIFSRIKKEAPTEPFTVSQVFQNILNFDKTIAPIGGRITVFDTMPSWHPARIAYMTYISNDSENIRKSALQGVQLRFQLFSDTRIREILSHDGIHLGDITLHPSAYFVITSDKSTATKPISSLFFSFLFKDAQDIFDHYAQIAKTKHIENPCRSLVAMLDEFFSIGVIGGSPEAFATTMSNSRKRRIYISIIVQVYSQIEALYGPKIRDVIQGGCSTLLYLGGNDPSTCAFISQFASGEATVLSESHRENAGMLRRGVQGDLAIRSDKRFLLTVDEARRWKNQVLVVKQGEFPLKLNPFPWTEHPCYKKGYITPSSVYSNVEALETRLFRLQKEAYEKAKQPFWNEFENITSETLEEFIPYESAVPAKQEQPPNTKSTSLLNQ